MLLPKPNAVTQVCASERQSVEQHRRHAFSVGDADPPSSYFLAVATVPPLSVHSFSLLVVKTCPLHEFLPWQALSLPAQAPWPPQPLSCLHCTFAAPVLVVFSCAVAAPAMNNEATAEATSAPFNVSFNINCSFGCGVDEAPPIGGSFATQLWLGSCPL